MFKCLRVSATLCRNKNQANVQTRKMRLIKWQIVKNALVRIANQTVPVREESQPSKNVAAVNLAAVKTVRAVQAVGALENDHHRNRCRTVQDYSSGTQDWSLKAS